MKTLGIVYNAAKPDIVARLGEVEGWIRELGAEPLAVPGDAPELAGADAVVVLGGDGTFLRAARMVTPRETPLLGVDLGTLGFLAEVEYTELPAALARLRSGAYTLESRMLLEVSHRRDGRELARALALNEGVVVKGATARLLQVVIWADDAEIARYGADGFIVSTPTGSTAYGLAAGGPIMSPDVGAFVLVPICPHTLSARPLVISADRTVRIVVETPAEDAMVAADGLMLGPVAAGDSIAFWKAKAVTRMVRVTDRGFFDSLRRKLQWGERPMGSP